MRRATVIATALGLLVGGCGTAVHPTQRDEAGDTVHAFLSDCAHGQWLAASGILAEGARETFLVRADKADACAEQLGLDPARLRRARAPRPAFANAAVERIDIHGDQAQVTVRTAGLTGTADLEDRGEEYRIATR